MHNFKQTIEYGLYLLVFILPLQTRWIIRPGEINGGYSEYLTISLYGTDIVLLLILTLFIISKLQITNYKLQINPKSETQNSKKNAPCSMFQVSRIWCLIAGLDLFVFISIFFAPDKSLAAYSYIRFLAGIGLFWIIISAEYNKAKLLFAFLGGVFVQAGLGLWQFLSQSGFANKWLGLAGHNPADLGVSVVETLEGGRWLRAYGGLDHPNILGGVLTIGILSILFLSIKNSSFHFKVEKLETCPSGRRIGNWKLGKYVWLLAFISSFFIFLISLFFTFSRGAWAGLIAGLALMSGLALLKKDYLAQKKILKTVLSASILIFLLFNFYGDLALTRLSDDTRLEAKSNAERIESLDEAREVVKDNWLFGVGIGNYAKHNASLRMICKPADECSIKASAWEFQPAHNVFLLVWSEIGILGLLFFISILIYAFYRLIKSNNNDIFKTALLFSAIVMFMADHWWWSLHFGILFFWLILGLTFQKEYS